MDGHLHQNKSISALFSYTEDFRIWQINKVVSRGKTFVKLDEYAAKEIVSVFPSPVED